MEYLVLGFFTGLSLILTFSACAEKIDKIEINPATSVVLIIRILSPFKFKN